VERTLSHLVHHEELIYSKDKCTPSLRQRAEYGRTVLHTAAERESRSKFIRFFLDHGADIESRDAHGRTPLLVAALERNLDAITVLLEAGADVHAVDNEGLTALHFTINSAQRAYDLLLEHGADPTVRSNAGRDPVEEYRARYSDFPLIPFIGQTYQVQRAQMTAGLVKPGAVIRMNASWSPSKMPRAYPFEKGILDASRF
jgi:ankyrin repeat protein